MEEKKNNRNVSYVIGGAFILIAVVSIFVGRSSIGSQRDYFFSFLMFILGASFFLPAPEKLSIWMYIRLILLMIAFFLLGYFWR